jgi:hypothetical protein
VVRDLLDRENELSVIPLSEELLAEEAVKRTDKYGERQEKGQNKGRTG